MKQKRKKEEANAWSRLKKPVSYPSFDDIRAEDDEEAPFLLFSISDADGKVIRRLKTSASAGVKRIHWDFRYPSTSPIRLSSGSGRSRRGGAGHMVAPGTYYVSLHKSENGVLSEWVGKQAFKVKALENTTLPAKDRNALVAFQNEVAQLSRLIAGANQLKSELDNKVKYMDAALQQTPEAPLSMYEKVKALKVKLKSIERRLQGDRSVSKLEIETPPSVSRRIQWVMYGMYATTGDPTQSQRDAYQIAKEEFDPLMKELNEIEGVEMKELEKALEAAGAPWTPGRILGVEEEER